MMLGLSAIRRLEAHVKRQETRQTIKGIADAFIGGALFVVFVFGAIALTAEPKLPGASSEIEAAYQRGYAAAMQEPRKVNLTDWSCK
jgi:hypothetical protein